MVCKECCICGEFLTTKAESKKHNFLKHYAVGEEKPPEEKPIDVIEKGDITIYQISYKEHSEDYDFFDPEKIVDEFLFNVKTHFELSDQNYFKGDFAIENIQDAPAGVPNTADIVDGIRNDILKRVINNKLSESPWHFNRFFYLNLKTIENSDKYEP